MDDIMLNLYNRTNHLLQENKKSLFAPLKQLGIKDFSYYKVNANGKAIYLSSNDAWHKKHYLTEGGMDGIYRSASITIPNNLQNVIFAGDVQSPHESTKALFGLNEKMNAEAMFDNDMWNSSCYYFMRNGCFESFNFFGGNDKTQLLDLFARHQNMLEQYMSFFIVQSKPIFSLLPTSEMFDIGLQPTTLISPESQELNIMHSLDKQAVSISPQQSSLLNFLSTGLPIKLVKEYLNISPSTANNYLIRLKAKLGFSDTNQLLHAWQIAMKY